MKTKRTSSKAAKNAAQTLLYGHGRIRRRGDGFIANLCGSQTRRTFRSLDQAKAWLDAQGAGDGLPALTAAQVAEAARAYAILPPGVSLYALAQAAAARAAEAAAPIDLIALCIDYIEDCRARLRPPTVAQYRRHLNMALTSPLLGADLRNHTKPTIRAYLDRIPSPHERTAALRTLSALYAHLIERDLLTANPCATIRPPRVRHAPPAILTLDQARTLIDRARDFENGALLPYIAVCLFAGIRPAEAMRLRPCDIGREYITLTASQTKTIHARTVPIQPNLRAILDRSLSPTARLIIPCSQSRFRHHLCALIATLPFAWSQDILRHSYASYRYEQTRNAAATASEMGHTGTEIFFQHYRGLVSPGGGLAFFSVV